MNKNITVLSGDGIGPEVVAEALNVLRCIEKKFNHNFTLRTALIGAIAIEKTGSPFPEETLNCCKNCDAILLGAVGDPKYDNDPGLKIRPEQGLLDMRRSLGLFANIRPLSIYKSLTDISPLKESFLENVDFVIYRELIGGIYFGDKTISEDKKTATDTCSYSENDIIKIAKLAFDASMLRKRKVTLVDKANVLETSRLWRKTISEVSKNYSEVTVDYLFVDNAAMQLILNPSQFDVILTENLFGDILSDEASVLSGSIGLLPSASVGSNVALFEPIHGSYPNAKGLGIANPLATILSLSMMLDFFKLSSEARLITKAVKQCIESKCLPKDLVKLDEKYFSTQQIGNFICDYIANC